MTEAVDTALDNLNPYGSGSVYAIDKEAYLLGVLLKSKEFFKNKIPDCRVSYFYNNDTGCEFTVAGRGRSIIFKYRKADNPYLEAFTFFKLYPTFVSSERDYSEVGRPWALYLDGINTFPKIIDILIKDRIEELYV